MKDKIVKYKVETVFLMISTFSARKTIGMQAYVAPSINIAAIANAEIIISDLCSLMKE